MRRGILRLVPDAGAERAYKLLLVPNDSIVAPVPGENADVAWIRDGGGNPVGPFGVFAEVGPGKAVRMSREAYDVIVVIDGTT